MKAIMFAIRWAFLPASAIAGGLNSDQQAPAVGDKEAVWLKTLKKLRAAREDI